MTKPSFATVAEAAALLKVREETVRRMVARNDLPAVRVGNLIRIPMRHLDKMADTKVAA